jgi:hypothetical protein
MLQSVQDQSEGELAQQLSQRLLEYQRQLKARSAPAQGASVEPIRQAIAAGQRLRALRLIREGLGLVPGEPALLAQQAVILALGSIAHQAVLRAHGLRASSYAFGHGAEHLLPNGRLLFDSYHCSRYNTQTKRLTPDMFREVVGRASARARSG